MTAQVSDSVRYQDRSFALFRVRGADLFEPARHGLQPQMMSTACYRGFICDYAVSDEHLFLEQLRIRLPSVEELKARHGRGAPLFGKQPRFDEHAHAHVVYEALHGPVPFSGGMLVARGFIQELYSRMGFPPAWKFEEVHELLFEEGRLVEARDCSEDMARVRDHIRAESLSPHSTSDGRRIKQALSKVFRLDYD